MRFAGKFYAFFIYAFLAISIAMLCTEAFAKQKQVIKICEGEHVVLRANVANAAAYQWFKDNQRIEGALSETYTVYKSGIYTVAAFNSLSCQSPGSEEIEVIVLPIPLITFPALQTRTYGDPDFLLNATASNTTEPVTYTVQPAGVVNLENGKITILGVGEVKITAIVNGQCPAVPVSQTLKINPAPLVVIVDNKTRPYAGTEVKLTNRYSGFVKGETEQILDKKPILAAEESSQSGSAPVSVSTKAGIYPITASGAQAKNYVISYQQGNLDITKLPVKIKVEDVVKLKDNKPFSYAGKTYYEGFVNGDNESLLSGMLKIGGTASGATAVGKYLIEPQGPPSIDNYNLSYLPATLTILDASNDLVVIKKSESRTVAVGEAFEYTLTVQNQSINPATKVQLNDVLPVQLDYLSIISVTQGTANYDQNSRILNWQIGNLQPSQSVVLRLQVKPNKHGQITNIANVSGEEPDSDMSNNTSSDTKEILGLNIPNVFTPNGDDKNDRFQIPGLVNFPDNNLKIFNRWGNSVYERSGYMNDWTGDGLNEGTYFYVLTVKNSRGETDTYKGYVTILRTRQ